MKKTFLISETDLAKLVNRILNESNPILKTIAKSIRPATRLKFVDSIDNLLTTGKIQNVNKSSIVMRDGDEVLTNFLGNKLNSKDMQKVFNSIFREVDDDQTIEVMSKYLLTRPGFVSKYEGMTDLDILKDLTSKYGRKQASVLKNGLLSLRPKVSSSYNMIFDGIPQNDAVEIIDTAIAKALDKGNFKLLKGTSPNKTEVVTQDPNEILELLVSGKFTDIFLLKKYIVNSIPAGPVPSAVNRVKNKIYQGFFTDDYLIPAKEKSIKEIEKSLNEIGITNKELASEIWKKVNPGKGIGTAFGKGINPLEGSPLKHGYNIAKRNFRSKRVLVEIQNANPVFKNVSGDDWSKLFFWALTGVGDYQKIKSIYRTYGLPAALGNLSGQYIKSYILANFIYWAMGVIYEAFATILTKEQIYPNEYEAFSDFIIGEFGNWNNLFTGPIGRILFNLGEFIVKKSPGGKLPVEVYDVIDHFKKMIGIAKTNQTDALRNLQNALQQVPETTTPTPTEDDDLR